MKTGPTNDEETKSELNRKVWGIIGTKFALSQLTYKGAENHVKRVELADPTVTIVTSEAAKRFAKQLNNLYVNEV
jgi:hypothetical protein